MLETSKIAIICKEQSIVKALKKRLQKNYELSKIVDIYPKFRGKVKPQKVIMKLQKYNFIYVVIPYVDQEIDCILQKLKFNGKLILIKPDQNYLS